MTTIADLKNHTVTVIPALGDKTTTVAHLARLVKVNISEAAKYKTSISCIAYDALEDEYGPFEKVDGHVDINSGAWMKFADGSEIRIVEN